MVETTDTLTPEKKQEIARLSTYFGIRPDATFTESLHVFEGMPEAERPTFTFKFMSSSMKEEYEDKMQKLMSRIEKESPAPKDETEDERVTRITMALSEHKAERNAIMYPYVRKCLTEISGLPYVDGATLNYVRGAETETPDWVWDSLSYALRPILANLLFTRSFVSEVEATAVKS